MKLKTLVIISIIFLYKFLVYPIAPNKINYQGRLRENGQPVSGVRRFQFRIYNASNQQVWQSPYIDVNISTGVYNVELDFSTGSGSINWSLGPYYLEVSVGPQGSTNLTTLSPREEIKSVPYSIYSTTSSYSLAIPDNYVTNSKLALDHQSLYKVSGGTISIYNGNVGISSSQPQHKLEVIGSMYSRGYNIGNATQNLTIDWNNGNVQFSTLTATTTNINFINGQHGGKYILVLKYQSSNINVNWPSNVRWQNGQAPILSGAGKTDYIGFIYNAIDGKYDAVGVRLGY